MTTVSTRETATEDKAAELTDGYHLVVDALKLNDVRTIYGVVGIPITDVARVAQASGIRYIGFRHESDAGQLKCKGWEADPNAYIYFTIQDHNWDQTCRAVGRPEWIDDPAYKTAKARETHIFEIFDEIEEWLADKTKYEAVDTLLTFEVPCAPVLSMKEIAHDPALRASGTVVGVGHKERGSYLTVGSPIKFSDFTPEITGAAARRTHRQCPRRPGV